MLKITINKRTYGLSVSGFCGDCEIETADLFYHVEMKCLHYSEERSKYISPSPVEERIRGAFLNILESPEINTVEPG